MRAKTILVVSSLMITALLITACGGATGEANPTENSNPIVMDDPTPTVEITPLVTVSDQDAASGSVTIQQVVAADPGWIVIHTEADGAPGPIIGFSQVMPGENSNVVVEIDLESATDTLFAMLHLDAGTPGTYEFPGDDVPVKSGDAIVMTPFMVSLPEVSLTPAVTVSDQETSGTVTIAEVVAADPGWIVIHTESDGAPGPIIGYAAIDAGKNSQVEVEIDLEAATDTLFAMLHLDAGTLGTYEFPGDDVPVSLDGAVVMTPFMVTNAEAGMGGSSDAVTVIVRDSTYEDKEITVKVGTTVTWTMNANFPHTVTADDGLFDSGRLSDGQSFSYTFDQAGEFPYYCTLHGGPGGVGMAGIVNVTE